MSFAPTLGFGVDTNKTPSRLLPEREESEDGDTDSSSPGNNTSDGSPSLRLALSGEDAIESPPFHGRSLQPLNRARNIKQISSPSDLEDDQDSSFNTSPSSSSDKPTQSYIALISMAILQHPEKKMLLGDIYQFIMDKFPHYRNATDKAWRNSIRHNLSINECFIKVGRADNGKGNYWAIHPACEEDFGKGDFRRRQARRRARRSQQVNISKMPLTYRYSLGYVPMKSTPATGEAGSGTVPGSYGVRSPTRSHPYARPTVQYQYPQQQAYGHQFQHSGMSSVLQHQNPYLPTVTTGNSPPGLPTSYQSTMISPLRGYSNHATGISTFTSSPSSLGASPFLPVSRSCQNNMGNIQGVYQSMYVNSGMHGNTMLSSRVYGMPPTTQVSSSSLQDSLSPCVYQSTGASPHFSTLLGSSSSSPPGCDTVHNTPSSSPTSYASLSPLSTEDTLGTTLSRVPDVSPSGGLSLYNNNNGSPLTNFSQLTYSDMPALRDAINGLTSLTS